MGGCTLDAIDATCNPDGELGIDLFDGVASLAAKSLLRQDDIDGEPRFSMLETIREYALERLEESGEAEEARRRHAEHFLGLADGSEPRLQRDPHGTHLAQLEREHDNLQAALAWGFRTANVGPELGPRLAGELTYFWFLSGQSSEGRRWLQQAMAASTSLSRSVRARVVYGTGFLTYSLDDYRGAGALLSEALALYRELDDPHGIGPALASLGIVCLYQGQYERAELLLQESLSLQRSLGDEHGIARAHNNLGFAAYLRGDLDQAARHLDEGYARSRAIGDEAGASVRLNHLAEVRRLQGDYARAKALAEESLTLARRSGFEEAGARSHQRLGQICLDQGDLAAAHAHLVEGFAVVNRIGHRPLMVDCLEGLAALAGRRGAFNAAVRLFAAVDAAQQQMGAHLAPYRRQSREESLATLRARLGDQRMDAEWAAGWAMSVSDAVDYALSIEIEASEREDPAQRAPATAIAPTAASSERSSPLSAREEEVAALVARGLTNRQIATELVIAERTAGSHVAHILDKLGFTTRAQIAAWAVEQGLARYQPT